MELVPKPSAHARSGGQKGAIPQETMGRVGVVWDIGDWLGECEVEQDDD